MRILLRSLSCESKLRMYFSHGNGRNGRTQAQASRSGLLINRISIFEDSSIEVFILEESGPTYTGGVFFPFNPAILYHEPEVKITSLLSVIQCLALNYLVIIFRLLNVLISTKKWFKASLELNVVIF